MFTFKSLRRQADHASVRQPRACRPLVDSLEGRQLLSALAPIQGLHIGTSVVAPSFSLTFTKIETSDRIQGGHIGTSVGAGHVGQHIGSVVGDAARAGASSDGTDTVRFFEQNSRARFD
jgi:hypothetical protein